MTRQNKIALVLAFKNYGADHVYAQAGKYLRGEHLALHRMGFTIRDPEEAWQIAKEAFAAYQKREEKKAA